MLSNITKPQMIVHVEYFIIYSYLDDPSRQFHFECEQDGTLKPLKFKEGEASLALCKNSNDITCNGIKQYSRRYLQVGSGKCTCGNHVELSDPLDNTCRCGRCYNMSGQEVIHSSLCDYQGNLYE